MRDKVSQTTLALAKSYTDEHGGGGGGGTPNYNDLSHLPTYEGKEWKGTLTKGFLELGDLSEKDSASGTVTPSGSVSVSQGEDTKVSVGSVTDVGTLPSLSVEGTKLTFNAGTLPTKSDVNVVTASGTRTASFNGTEATVTVS